LWNFTTGKEVRTLNNHTCGIYQSIDLVNNCRYFVSGSSSQTIKLWNWSTGECLNTIKTNSFFQSLAVVNHGKVKTKTRVHSIMNFQHYRLKIFAILIVTWTILRQFFDYHKVMLKAKKSYILSVLVLKKVLKVLVKN
jgi:WD40 repeat protein